MKASLQISAGTRAVSYSCAATNRAGTSSKKSAIIIVTKGGEVKVKVIVGYIYFHFLTLHLYLSTKGLWGLPILKENVNLQLQTSAKGL